MFCFTPFSWLVDLYLLIYMEVDMRHRRVTRRLTGWIDWDMRMKTTGGIINFQRQFYLDEVWLDKAALTTDTEAPCTVWQPWPRLAGSSICCGGKELHEILKKAASLKSVLIWGSAVQKQNKGKEDISLFASDNRDDTIVWGNSAAA